MKGSVKEHQKFSASAADKDSASNLAAGRSSLISLRRAAAGCQACDLWKNATQTVFGEGSPKAMIMFVGEQPGDREDLAGRPFVGPAGNLLDEAVLEAGSTRLMFTSPTLSSTLSGSRRNGESGAFTKSLAILRFTLAAPGSTLKSER
jgi:uracil-DNA glycosylase